MRSPTAIATHGTGKSRSKPLHKRSIRNLIAQHKGYQKTMALYDAVIRKTAPVKTVHMSKLRQSIQRGLISMKGKKRPLKLNIHNKSGTV